MEFKTEELLVTFAKARAGLAKKDIVDAGKSFLLTGEEIITFNDYISVQVPFKTDFSCAVIADEFFKVISKIKKETLDLSYNKDTNEVVINAGKIKASLICSGAEVGKITESVKAPADAKFLSLPADFMDAIALTISAASTDMTKPILTCLSVDSEGIASSDNLRISKYVFKEAKMKKSFLLPASAAIELLSYKTMKKYFISESWVFFKDDAGIVFSAKILSGEYPDVSPFFDIKGTAIDLPEKLIESIETASILADGDFTFDKKIEISYKNKKVMCKGVTSDVGWVSSTITCETKEELSFQINPFFFKEMLKHSMKAQVSDNGLLFTSANFKHIVSLFD
jgi:DNA polymerase III sliding clamp (beta) subunit (PCNA family)